MIDWTSLLIGGAVGAIFGIVPSVAISWYFWRRPASSANKPISKARIALKLDPEDWQKSRGLPRRDNELTSSALRIVTNHTEIVQSELRLRLVKYPRCFKPAGGVRHWFSLDWVKRYDDIGYFDFTKRNRKHWDALNQNVTFVFEIENAGSKHSREARPLEITKDQVFESLRSGRTSREIEAQLLELTGRKLSIFRSGS